MGTLLQSRPVTSKIIAPQWFRSPPWITAAELSSSLCYLSPPSCSAYGFFPSLSLFYSPSNMLTTWLITALTLPMAAPRKRGSSKHVVLSMKMFPLLLVGAARAFSSSVSGKLLNNRSCEAVGSLWHLSPITAEPPFSCHRPDQLVFYIYDPLSALTPVEHRSPRCLTPFKQTRRISFREWRLISPCSTSCKTFKVFLFIVVVQDVR